MHRPFGSKYDQDCLARIEVPPFLPNIDPVRRDLATLCHQVELLDARVGKILDALDQGNLTDNTVVVFTTEHGPAIARAKHTLFDAGLKIALLLRYPRRIKPGIRSDRLLSNVDLFPTLLELCNLPIPGGIHGLSFLEILDDNHFQGRNKVFSEQTWGRRSGKWFYTPARSVRTDRYKYLHSFCHIPFYVDNGWLSRFADDVEPVQRAFCDPLPEAQLFDLHTDPYELSNLADSADHRECRESLRENLFEFLEETEDPILNGPVSNKLGMPDFPQWIEQPDGSFLLGPDEPFDARESTFT